MGPVPAGSEGSRAGTGTATWRVSALLLLLGALWGTPFTLSKLASSAGVPPTGYMFWQCLGGAIATLLACLIRGERLNLSWVHLRFYIVTGLIGMSLPLANMYYVLRHVPAGVMAIVAATLPLFTYLIATAIGVERIRLGRLGGIACGFLGAMLLLLPRSKLPEFGPSLWLLLAFATPLLYASCHVYVSRALPSGTGITAATTGMLIAATVTMLPVLLLTDGWYPLHFPIGIGESAIIGQVMVSSLGYLLVFQLIRAAGPVYFSQVSYLVTVSGMVWAALVFGEVHPPTIWMAVILIFVGAALVGLQRQQALSRRRPSKPSYPAQKQQYHYDQQHQADTAARIVAPAAAIWPSWNDSDKKNDQYYKENSAARHISDLR